MRQDNDAISGREEEHRAPDPEDGAPAEGAPSECVALPVWITPDLIARTQRVFASRYNGLVNYDDAVRMVLRVGMLLDVLGGNPQRARDRERERSP